MLHGDRSYTRSPPAQRRPARMVTSFGARVIRFQLTIVNVMKGTTLTAERSPRQAADVLGVDDPRATTLAHCSFLSVLPGKQDN